MISRIEDFLNKLDRKNLIFLYLSLFLGGVVVYINFNMNFLKDEENSYKAQIRKYMKLKDNNYLSKLSLELRNLDKEKRNLLKKEFKLQSEIKRLKTLIYTSSVLNVTDREFADILKKILYNSIKFNVKISLTTQKSVDNFKVYTLQIDGISDSIYNVYKFVRSVEKLKKVKKIDNFNLNVNNGVSFNFELKIWGYK